MNFQVRQDPRAGAQAPTLRGRSPLLDVVMDLGTDVSTARFPLDLPGADRLRDLRERLETQISAHLLPRLRQSAGPAVVVVGGSTGAGKSTLVNTVVGHEVTQAGVLRPTTREPVVVVHPDDAPFMDGHPVTELARLVLDDGVPAGLALLDAPDLDSVHADNRALAARLLETADLWIFVTTAARYGDALPWSVLAEAHERGVSTAVVLNRVPRRVLAEVRRDLLGRLDGLGLGSAPLFIVPDAGPHEGLLPPGWMTELTGWFALLARRHQSQGIVRRTTRAVWADLRQQLLTLADGMAQQAEAAQRLRNLAQAAAEPPAERVVDALAEGTAARGAPTTRWLALASTGGPLARVATKPGAVRRGWRGRGLAAREAAAAQLGAEVRAALVTLLTDAVRAGIVAVRVAWRTEPLGGAELLDRLDQLPAQPTDPARAAAEQAITGWAASVREAVEQLGTSSPALEPAGLSALVQAAAAGVDGAAETVRGILGTAAEPLLERARTDLGARTSATVRAVATRFAWMIDDLDLHAEAAAGLRLRASELKGHA